MATEVKFSDSQPFVAVLMIPFWNGRERVKTPIVLLASSVSLERLQQKVQKCHM